MSIFANLKFRKRVKDVEIETDTPSCGTMLFRFPPATLKPAPAIGYYNRIMFGAYNHQADERQLFEIMLSPESAIQLAQRMLEAAQKAKELNEHYGYDVEPPTSKTSNF